MRERDRGKALLIGLMVALSLSVTACGKSDEPITDSTEVETLADGSPVVDSGGGVIVGEEDMAPVETDADGNPIVIEEKQAVGQAQVVAETKAQERPVVPIRDTDLGEWTKTKNGFMFKDNSTGEFVKGSIVTIDGIIYYFDTEGYLQDDVFVPDGTGRTFYIKDYQYYYGLVEREDGTYYIDQDKGRLELCKVQIGDERYCFDKEGKNISEVKWDKQYSELENISEESTEDEGSLTASTDETTSTEDTPDSTEETPSSTEETTDSTEETTDSTEETKVSIEIETEQADN